jgi:hypothetical protein
VSHGDFGRAGQAVRAYQVTGRQDAGGNYILNAYVYCAPTS